MASKRTIVLRLIVVALLVALAALFRTLPVGEWLIELQLWVGSHPVAGAIFYVGLTILAIVAAVPGWIPMMLAGLAFGFFPGFVYALLGTVVGATAAMLVGRTLVRSWIEKRIADNPRLLALDDALDEQAFVIVALTRIALVIPFNLLNYAYGLTRVNSSVYAVATTVGMIPVVALYVYFGSLAADVGQILGGDQERGGNFWWLAGLAVVALVIVVWIVRRAVRRALDRHLPADEEKQANVSE